MKRKTTIVLAMAMTAMMAFALFVGTSCSSGETGAGANANAGGTTGAGSQGEAPIVQAGDAVVFSMHCVDAPTSPVVKGGKKIAQLVSEATEGRVSIDVVSGSQASERELLQSVLDGKLDIAVCSHSALVKQIPQMKILNQPFLWETSEDAHVAIDGTLGALIKEQAQKKGFHVIGIEESGFRNVFSTKPIRSLDDFKGLTIRTAKNTYFKAAFESFGAEPVTMASDEVIDAFGEGKIDACEDSTIGYLTSRYYRPARNITYTNHAITLYMLCMSDEAWNRIPAELREPFSQAIQEGVEWERTAVVDAENDAHDELRGLGVYFNNIDIVSLRKQYFAKAAEEGFKFDLEWQAAIG